MNLVEVLDRRARRHPERPAIVEGAGRRRRVVSYADLERRSAAGARFLADRGVREGEAVLFVHPVSIELYEALLAVFRLGAAAVFVDPSAGRGVVAAAVRRLAPRAFFGSPKAHLLRLIQPGVLRIPVQISTGGWAPAIRWGRAAAGEAPIADCGPEAPALVTFTSGSTGAPKAAVRTHRFLLAQYEILSKSIGLRDGQTDLVTLPVFVFANLAAGVTSVLADTDLSRPGAADGRRVGRQMEAESVTRVTASPAFFEALLRREADLGGLGGIYTGGAPVFPSLLRRLRTAAPGARVEAVYGSTEAEPIAHVAEDEIDAGDLEEMRTGGGLLAGRPVDEVRLAVLPNRWGTPLGMLTAEEFAAAKLAAGVAGEIAVTGPHVLKGYLDGRGDEETKFRAGDDVWHRTGDAGRLDHSGRLWLLGRAGAVIRRPEGALYPFAVEAALSFRDDVRRSALVELGGEAVLAVEFHETKRGSGLAGVRETVSWARLDRVVELPAIPVDRRHNAKVDHLALKRVLGKVRFPG